VPARALGCFCSREGLGPRHRNPADSRAALHRYYDVKVGGGQLAKVGDRVAVHYEARWRGITFMTSR